LPQHYIEQLCNDIEAGNEERFSKELQKVIFSHVKPEDRLGKGTMEDLLEFMIRTRREAYSQVQQLLRTLNDTIHRKEQESSDETIKSYEASLALKEGELLVLDANPIPVVAKPPETPDEAATKASMAIETYSAELVALEKKISSAELAHSLFVGEEARIRQLVEYTNNFEATYETFCESRQVDFTAAGFDVRTIVTLTTDRTPMETRLAEIATKLTELNLLLDGRPATDTESADTGLREQSFALAANIISSQNALNVPLRAYHAYLREQDARDKQRLAIVGAAETPETIEYFKARVSRAKTDIPAELTKHYDERKDLVRNLHAELLAMREIYEKLYEPVQKVAAEAANSTYSDQLRFDATVANTRFEGEFIDFIHRGKRGNFYGDDESHATIFALIESCDFNNTESVVTFTETVFARLISTINKDGDSESITVASQLREKKKITDLYDFIFGLGYLEIRYNLRLGTKDISQLSPGEKGALLLVFYLLLDVEEIPIIIDQPEHNLDNESVVRLLVECIRTARSRRQVIIVTHNPNLAVYCDADQVICCSIDKANRNRIEYESGAIEDYPINKVAVNVLEGTYAAFDNRSKKWHKPE
jgi:hypothetical protein